MVILYSHGTIIKKQPWYNAINDRFVSDFTIFSTLFFSVPRSHPESTAHLAPPGLEGLKEEPYLNPCRAGTCHLSPLHSGTVPCLSQHSQEYYSAATENFLHWCLSDVFSRIYGGALSLRKTARLVSPSQRSMSGAMWHCSVSLPLFTDHNHDHEVKMVSTRTGHGTVRIFPACQCRRREIWVQSLGLEDPLGEGMAAHSSVLAWRIPWTEEPGGLQSIGSQGVGHDWIDWSSQANSEFFLF